ncbi:DUF7117 family protein [Haloplanus aerogenes]|uniref:TFIIB-type zinc ribbon-containing protein n=1 Tax=Haloplanus aerogenes TaxID=660522 RepID=A0A3M0D9H5_9EURY|nr:hypothetical protein [Haloplanus aerogenes]AZH26440.1 hypothetical protein DU502_14155 [Haloplanus aerogenes]RMB18094.1 hypothetical protein ATH50_1541 [Haloplanus aerogenes]
MKVRGQRECQACGHQWSYYETGSVACPACESLRSVGVDDRTLHTDAPATLDLSPYRAAWADDTLADHVDDCKSDLREYLRQRGFVDGGDLRLLDDTVLAASELLQVIDLFGRERDPTDADESYLLALLRGADEGERPPPETVSAAWSRARGLGYANAVDDYRRDVIDWLEEHPDEEARKTLGTIRERVKRMQALQGDVSPAEVESLVHATREVGEYLMDGEESSLASARERLRDR